jgi:hypothetical protein
VVFQLVRHGPFDFCPLLGCQQPAIDENIGKWQCLCGGPSRTGFYEAVGVNGSVLECNHAEEQIEVGIHGSLLNGFRD